MLSRYLDWLLRHRRVVVVISLLLALLASAGMARLSVDDDFRVYFSEDNPQLAALDTLEGTFTKDDNLSIVVYPETGDIFDRRTLTLLHELTEDAWRLPYSLRVDSLANYQHTTAEGDTLRVEPLVGDPAELDAGRIAYVREVATATPGLTNSLVPADGRGTWILIRLALPDGDGNAGNEAVFAARELIDRYRLRYPELRLLLAGSETANVVLGEAVVNDLTTLVPLTLLIITAGLVVLLRSLLGTAATLALITLSIAATMGLFGWLGTRLAPVAGFVPTIVMTIAVADSVHVLVTFFWHLRHGEARDQAVREAMRINASPVFITSVTTIIGVLSLNFSDSPPYRDLGNMVAVGVAAAYLLSMTFLPALLASVPERYAGRIRRYAPDRPLPMDGFASWVIARRRWLLLAGTVVVAVVSSFIWRNELSERWFEYFDPSFEYRRAVDLINDEIAGIDGMVYLLDSGRADGVNDPAYLQTLEDFANWLRDQPGVVNVSTLTDTQKRLNMNLNGDDPEAYRLPQRRDLAAQYLLLYELSLPEGLGLDDTVSIDRSATRFGVLTTKMDSTELLDLERRAAAWLERNGGATLEPAEATGLDVIFAHMNHRNMKALLQGTAFALVLISLALIVALRSLRLGLISLVPNLAPAALAYGLWGMFVGRVDVAASVVIAMSIGIVVDDTVHFMSKYRRARRERSLSQEQAIHYAFNTVGVALTITTAVLVGGFLVLLASPFNPTLTTGTLLALTLAIALVVDFLFLPPLLLTLDRPAPVAAAPQRLGEAADA